MPFVHASAAFGLSAFALLGLLQWAHGPVMYSRSPTSRDASRGSDDVDVPSLTTKSPRLRGAAEFSYDIGNWENAPLGWWAWPRGAVYEVMMDGFPSPAHPMCSNCSSRSRVPFQDVRGKLSYLEDLGVDGMTLPFLLDITPIDFHDRGVDLTAPSFGSTEDLRSLVLAAKRKGVKVFLDTDPSINCGQDEQCARLYNVSNSTFAYTLAQWLRIQVDSFGFDGVRVRTDSLPHEFPTRLVDGGPPIPSLYDVAIMSEDVLQRSTSQPYDVAYNYPLYYAIRAAFAPGSRRWSMAKMLAATSRNRRSRLMLNFLDNHNVPRFSDVVKGDEALLRNALLFLLSIEGVPMLSGGIERGAKDIVAGSYLDQDTFGLTFRLIKRVLHIRKYLQGLHKYKHRIVRADDDFVAFTRGPLFVVANRIGTRKSSREMAKVVLNYDLHAPAANYRMCNVLATNPRDACLVVSRFTRLELDLSDGEPKLFIPETMLDVLPSQLFSNEHSASPLAEFALSHQGFKLLAQSRWHEMPNPPQIHVRAARRMPRAQLPPNVVLTDRPDWKFASDFEIPRHMDLWAPPVGAPLDYEEIVRVANTCHHIDVDIGLRVMVARRGSTTYALCPGDCGDLPRQLASMRKAFHTFSEYDARPILHLTYGKLYVGGLYHMLVQILPGVISVLPQLRKGSMRLFLDGPWKLLEPSLSRLGVSREVLIIPPAAGETMTFCSAEIIFGRLDDHPSQQKLRDLRDALALPTATTRKSIVVLSRGSDPRSISNEAALATAMRVSFGRDVEIIHPGHVELAFLVDALSRAEVIVGVHGANLANMIYAPSGTKVLEIVPQVPFNPVNYHYRALAGSLDFPYRPVGQHVTNFDSRLAADAMTQSIAVQTFPVDINLVVSELGKLLDGK